MRLNAIMALATVASVVGVVSASTMGSLGVRHHYFQSGGPGSKHGGVRVEVTSQLTGGFEPAPLAFMLLSDLHAQPPGGLNVSPGPSPGADFGIDVTSALDFGSEHGFGGDNGLGGARGGPGSVGAAELIQTSAPTVSPGQDTPPSPAGASGFASGGTGPFFSAAPPTGPGTPPVGNPPSPPIVNPPTPVVFTAPPSDPPVVPPKTLTPLLFAFSPPPETGKGPDPGSAIPEPTTWLMLGLGLGLAGAPLRRRRGRLGASATTPCRLKRAAGCGGEV